MKLATLIATAVAGIIMIAAAPEPAAACGWKRGGCGCHAVNYYRPVRHYRHRHFYRPVHYYRPAHYYRHHHAYRHVHYYRPVRHYRHHWHQ